MAQHAPPAAHTNHPRRSTSIAMLGPAFVAAIAYVDPGNVAANLTAGARYGYLLVWVLIIANTCAVVVQYLSAKLGIVTGKSLAETLGNRLNRTTRIAYWVQAEIVAGATDIAEIIGGALALHLLFGLPLLVGGIITGAVSMLLLGAQQRNSGRTFEKVVTGMLAILTIGFCAGLVYTTPDPAALLAGVIPRFDGSGSVLLAASMLGATVMPHAVYLHSALARDRHGRATPGQERRRALIATRWDVALALMLAGGVNIAMLVLAASTLQGAADTDTIVGAQHAITTHIGAGIGILFSIGLLMSGLASTSVGAMAGSEIMSSLLHVRVPIWIRRIVTLIPALALLAAGTDATTLLVLSQVVLSFGIAFAVIPLVSYTSKPSIMGNDVNTIATRIIGWIVAAVIITLNVTLLWQTIGG